MSFARDFEQILSDFKASLHPTQLADLQIVTAADVEAAIASIEAEQSKNRLQRCLRRIEPFVYGLRRYARVVEQFVQIKPDILAAIWGPLKLILQVTANTLAAFDTILDTCQDIGECLPRFESLEKVLGESQRFRKVLLWLYTDILEFYGEVLRLLRKKAWKHLFTTLWGGIGERFELLRDRISQHRDIIDSEASAIDILRADKFRQEACRFFEEEQKRRTSQLLADLKNWLDAPAFDHDLQRHHETSEASPAKGSWLFDDQRFENWCQSDIDRVLWLTGIPGAGKTMLSYQIWAHLDQRSTSSCSIAIPVFLNDDAATRDLKPHSTATTIRSIILQLIQADSSTLLAIAHQYMEEASKHILGREKKSVMSLLDKLLEATDLTNVFIIMDGIDEVISENRLGIIQCLLSICAKHGTVRLLISSRNTADVRSELLEKPTVVANEHNAHEISGFVSSCKGKLMSKFRMEETEVTQILEKISSQSDGMFLYSRLMTHTLLKQVSRARLRQAVTKLPKGLDEAYAKIVGDILLLEDSEKSTALQVLEFMTCAKTRPRVAEIQLAISIQPQDTEVDPENAIVATIDDICGPIVEVKQGLVRFVHFTAKEFIQLKESKICISKEDVQSHITLLALTYMNFSCFSFDIDPESINDHLLAGDYAWLNYVELNWLDHLFLTNNDKNTKHELIISALDRLLPKWWAPGHIMNEKVAQQAVSVFRPPGYLSNDLQTKIAYLAFHRSQVINSKTNDQSSRPLTFDHFSQNVRVTLDKIATDPSTEEDTMEELRYFYGPLLFVCSDETCERRLIGFESDEERIKHSRIHEKPYKCGQADCEYNKIGFRWKLDLEKHRKVHETIEDVITGIQNLQPLHDIPSQASVNQRETNEDQERSYMIQDAIMNSDIRQLEYLLTKDLDVTNTQKGSETEYRMFLRAVEAAGGINLDVTKFVLGYLPPEYLRFNIGKLLSAIDSAESLTVLMECESFPDETITYKYGEFLHLEHMLISWLRRTPFPHSLIHAALETVDKNNAQLRRLLNDPHVKIGILGEALENGNASNLVELAQTRGVRLDPNIAQEVLGHKRKISHDPELLPLLLDAGADVNSSPKNFPSPLIGACISNDIDRVRFLIEHGAYIPFALGALWTACERAHVEIIRLLLDHGANPNEKYLEPKMGQVETVPFSATMKTRKDPVAQTLILEMLAVAGADPQSAKGPQGKKFHSYDWIQNLHKYIDFTWDGLLEKTVAIRRARSEDGEEKLAWGIAIRRKVSQKRAARMKFARAEAMGKDVTEEKAALERAASEEAVEYQKAMVAIDQKNKERIARDRATQRKITPEETVEKSLLEIDYRVFAETMKEAFHRKHPLPNTQISYSWPSYLKPKGDITHGLLLGRQVYEFGHHEPGSGCASCDEQSCVVLGNSDSGAGADADAGEHADADADADADAWPCARCFALDLPLEKCLSSRGYSGKPSVLFLDKYMEHD